MTKQEALAVIEALFFTATESIKVEAIATTLDLSKETVMALLKELGEQYDGRASGLQLVEVAGGYQLCTRPWVAPYLAQKPKLGRLSPAALETLAIIAYKQPITRMEIEAIRGVRVERALVTLVERDLITEVGRREGPGRPILYGTTLTFLQCFGLKDLTDLPQNHQLREGLFAIGAAEA